jgi:hypothetical protein
MDPKGDTDPRRREVSEGASADLEAEAIRVLAAADAQGVVLRALGGLAVKLICPSAGEPPLARSYKDLDLATRHAESSSVTDLLASLGYEPDLEFNALHGLKQLYFWDALNGRQLDVFVDRIDLSHTLEIADRLEVSPRTLSPADLLLTKLQVVEVNEKDLQDASALLADQPISPEGIDPARIIEILCDHWGWWRTCTRTLDSVASYAASLDGFARRDDVARAARGLRAAIDAAPKSVRWRMRSIIGERVRWYELPEETGA